MADVSEMVHTEENHACHGHHGHTPSTKVRRDYFLLETFQERRQESSKHSVSNGQGELHRLRVATALVCIVSLYYCGTLEPTVSAARRLRPRYASALATSHPLY